MKIRTSLIILQFALLAFSGAASAQEKTPVEWVAQLGADNLKDRDVASAALLSLGPKARDAVRDALDSKDAEVKSRAHDLWPTLRWLVVPDSVEDTKNLLVEAEKGEIDQPHWEAFVQKHGAASLLLVEEFRDTDDWPADTRPEIERRLTSTDAKIRQSSRAMIYQPGLLAVLGDSPPADVARLVTQADNATRARLDDLLGALPYNLGENVALNVVQIETALWHYQHAYIIARNCALTYYPGDSLYKACASAVDRGGMFDKLQQDAVEDVAAETNSYLLCVKLSFYTALFADLGKKSALDPVFDAAHADNFPKASDGTLRRLIEALFDAGMPERAVKVLHDVQTPGGLYMRSAADLRVQNESAAGDDWSAALKALDKFDEAKKQDESFSLGILMDAWHDERAVMMWRKVLAIKAGDTFFDAIACFHMGVYFEKHAQYANAADFYEKGLALSPDGSIMPIATTPDGTSMTDDKKIVLDVIRDLRSRAAGQKSLFKTPAPAGGGGSQ